MSITTEATQGHTTRGVPFFIDDAGGFAGNPVSMLRDQLRSEQVPMQRLPLMAAILGAYSASAQSPVSRERMARLYDYDQHRKPAQRKRENVAAMALLAQIDAGQVDASALTIEQKGVLAKYSGTGGALIGADGKKGSAYEYYTPLPIAEGVWDVLRELGFAGGKTLDHCGGSGVFGAAAPEDAVMDVVELNETSGRVNALVNAGPGYSVTVSPFEKVAAATPDETYDAVVSNVPFGSLADRGGNQLYDKQYQKEPLQNYFILRGLEKLRGGGVAAFITPPRCMSGKDGKEKDLRYRVSLMADFIGAYRLPNTVFGTAGADTMTDVMFFRKFSPATREKIAELQEQDPQKLHDAKVLWDEFLDGGYFKGEGHRFVLGEFVAKDPNKFRDVDRVVSSASVGEIGKLMRKLPDSRIDWSLLETTETAPIVYHEGDTLTQAGQTLQLTDGQWVPLQGIDAQSRQQLEMLAQLATPYGAFEGRVSFEQAVQLRSYMLMNSQALDIPGWLAAVLQDLGRLPPGDRSTYWTAAVVGLAVDQVIEERSHTDTGVVYVDEYQALSAAMQTNWSTAKGAGMVGARVKQGLRFITLHYSKKSGFSAFWRGDVQQDVASLVPMTRQAGFDGLRYHLKSAWVPLDKAREVLGADFDPLTSDEFCISGDGQSLTVAADYYSGNYADFLRRINAEIEATTDEKIKAKLVRQKVQADERIERVDVSKLEFNLFSPHVTAEEKAEFLRRFVHPSAAVIYDENTGKARPDIDFNGKDLTDRDKLIKRIGDYLKNGTITLGGAQMNMDKSQALKELASMVRKANEQFNAWSRSNQNIIGRLQGIANDPQRMRFMRTEDEEPMIIPGMNPELKLHGYQNSYVRDQAREFGGGNGFRVGLGKTFTALACVQHVQSIGVKKKTAFVVPGSVLSNWRKESKKAYNSIDDCLFIGLRDKGDGDYKVDSAYYDEDLTRIRENRHSKIFMTMEAWERLRLRDDTIQAFGAYMRANDNSFAEVQDKKQDERNKGKAMDFANILREKTGGAPYLEDLGIDSMVSDEAHAYKNSSDLSEFSSAKYLSIADAAKRGIDMQAKAWFIRGMSQQRDGVMTLTATPITNSPLEIYSMLALSVGHDRVNDMMLGVKGADQFMQMMCQIDTETDVTMDGITRETNVFTGLNNVEVLRKAMHSVYTIKSAEDIGAQITVPNRENRAESIQLPEPINARLKLYKEAFRYAIDTISEKKEIRGSEAAFDEVQAFFGEPIELIGHPFNLINKMTMLIMDPELDERATFFTLRPDQREEAQKVIEAFNGKGYTETRPRPGPHTAPDAIVGTKIKKSENGDQVNEYKIEVRAKLLPDGRILIDSIDPDTQAKWDAIATKSGLDLDVTIPAKLSAMLANIQKERATPRGRDAEGNPSPIVKQLIFCDVLALHQKIKRILSKHAGVSSGKIAVITGRTNNKPEEVLAVQDGFNASGEANKYEIVMGNEKMEVGLNLQIGTQANHHLTIGWTPDAQEQRDGRSVRQGNKTEYLTLYFYDADGTFDTSKRSMVNRKADWIDQVMSATGGNRVSITGGMSAEQITALIETVGDSDAMRRVQESLDAKEAEQRAKTNRERQRINLDTIQRQRLYLDQNPTAMGLVIRKILGYRVLKSQVQALSVRASSETASATSIARAQGLLAEADARLRGLENSINASVVFEETRGAGQGDLQQFLQKDATGYRGPLKDDDLKSLIGRGDGTYKLRIIEGAPIHAEWEADTGVAKSMIEQSVRAFESQAQEPGSITSIAGQALAEGKAKLMVNGEPIINGALSRLKSGNLGIYQHEGDQLRWYEPSQGDSGVAMFMAGRHDPKFINPGESGYEELLQEAASIEDESNAGNLPTTLYSKMVPQVSERRKTAPRVAYISRTHQLPSPYFPRLVSPIAAARGPVLASLHESQKPIVLGFSEDGDRFFTAPGAEITKCESDPLGFNKALQAYARSHGLSLNYSELKIEGNEDDVICIALREIMPRFSEDFAALLAQADLTAEAIGQGALEVLQKHVTWLKIDEYLADSHALRQTLARVAYSTYRAWSQALQAIAAREAAEAAAQASKAEPTPAAPSTVPQAGADPMEATAFVSISGDTMRWKDRIKSVAGAGGYRWDGDHKVWNVRRASWDRLIELYPDAAIALQINKAQGKLPR